MEVIKTDIEGVLIIEPKVFGDNRGCFSCFFQTNCRETDIIYKKSLCMEGGYTTLIKEV